MSINSTNLSVNLLVNHSYWRSIDNVPISSIYLSLLTVTSVVSIIGRFIYHFSFHKIFCNILFILGQPLVIASIISKNELRNSCTFILILNMSILELLIGSVLIPLMVIGTFKSYLLVKNS